MFKAVSKNLARKTLGATFLTHPVHKPTVYLMNT